MKTEINITATAQDMDRFADREDLRQFYKEKGIDGVELMLCGSKSIPDKITPEDINGIHLHYYTHWVDFWKGNTAALDREYGEKSVWKQYYGGENPDDLLKIWQEELEIAQRAGASYVVFHVAECSLEECTTYRMHHTDEEVCTAACEIINRLLDGKDYSFYFLVENLWWSGLTMTRPEVTKLLLEGIHYPKKGIMLDTGHLLHTNHELHTQEEAVSYIHEILDRNGELTRYIKGIHLHQSLTGEYVRKAIASPVKLTGDYWSRLSQIFPHIFQIDTHKPFTADGVAPLIRRIAPEFITYELITCSREEHEEALNLQLDAIKRNGGIL